MIRLWIPGPPIGKMRARTFERGGKIRTITPAKTKRYEDMIRDRVTYMVRPGAEPEAFVWAVECQIFVLDPKSPEGTFCGLMPDTDNVIKSVLDAAQACFGNDSRVSYEAGWKWTTRDHAKAGVGLTIWPLGIWRQGDQEEIPSEWREKRDYWEGKRT